MTQNASRLLSREEASDRLGLELDFLGRLEEAGLLEPDAQGRYEPLALAAAVIRYGLGRASAADRKLAEVGTTLGDVRPALERLAALPDKTELKGESYERVMIEVAAFFTAFADVMNRATAALHADDDPAAGA